MKKYYHLILAVLCSALLFSCKEPDPVDEPVKEATLKVEPTLVKFTSAAGSNTIKVTTEASAWNASAKDAAWLKISPETGNSSADVTLTVE